MLSERSRRMCQLNLYICFQTTTPTMRKIIAGINMTLDGICDHTAVSADEELHQHYADLLKTTDTTLYGRVTYELMEYWKAVVENPTGEKSTDEFAVVMDKIEKVVFSNTLKSVDWKTARLATQSLEEEVKALKQQTGKHVLVGSRSLIIQLLQLNLIDEFQLCIHPIIAGKGLPLFDKITDPMSFKLLKTKMLNGGAVVFYYQPNP